MAYNSGYTNQIKQEYWDGRTFRDPKITLFRERERLINNINRTSDKIGVNMIYSFVNTLMGLYFEDIPQAVFASRQVWNDDLAENINNIAKYDYEEMNMAEIDYSVQWNRFFYGVGIKYLEGWNDITKAPKVRSIDPRTLIIDPRWWRANTTPRFVGFEVESTIRELKECGMDLKNLDKVAQELSDQQQQDRIAQTDSRGLTPNISNQDMEQWTFSVYYHYTFYEGKPYMSISTTPTGDPIVLYAEFLPEVSEAEKKGEPCPFPFSFHHYSPLEGDPWGICVADLLEDKQKANSLFVNLMKIKATREALGGLHLYDQNSIKNAQDLRTPTVGPKFIAVDGTRGNIQNSVFKVPEDRISSDVFNMTSVFDAQANSDTGLDDQVRGLAAQGTQTATESSIIQQNANTKLVLQTRINGRAERRFWGLWYRTYQQFFSSADKKFARINNGFDDRGIEFKKKDFIGMMDPDISIKSRTESESGRAKEKANFMALFPILIQMPDMPEMSRRYLYRKSLRLSGIDHKEINNIVPKTPEEMTAEMQVEMINVNIVPEIDNLDEDHMTYILIYQKAMDNPAKQAATEARIEAYIESGQGKREQAMQQMAAQQGAGQGVATSAASQLMSQQSSMSAQTAGPLG